MGDPSCGFPEQLELRLGIIKGNISGNYLVCGNDVFVKINRVKR